MVHFCACFVDCLSCWGGGGGGTYVCFVYFYLHINTSSIDLKHTGENVDTYYIIIIINKHTCGGRVGGVIGFYFNRVCVKFCGKIFTDTLWVGGWVNACINWFYLWPSSLLTGEPDQSHRMAWTWKCADIYIYMYIIHVCLHILFVCSINIQNQNQNVYCHRTSLQENLSYGARNFIQKKYLFASDWGCSGHGHAGLLFTNESEI